MGSNSYFSGPRGQWELFEELIITNCKVVLIPNDFRTELIYLGSITFYSYMLALLSLCPFLLSVGYDY